MLRHSLTVAALVASTLVMGSSLASAQSLHRSKHIPVRATEDRPLTITGRRHAGIYRSGNDIIAPGGFSAHGYGYPAATPDERREALNARIRANASGPYGYGVDGLGGLGFEDDPETGYNNPFYGNAYNSYVGYNGVPTDLAFGPGYANRHIADHDPTDDDDDAPAPSPASLGYSPAE